MCTRNKSTCIKHVDLLPVHTGTCFERTHGSVLNLHTGVGGEGRGEGEEGRGSSPVLLTKQGPRGVFTFPREVHQKQPLDLTHMTFESKSRTTCHRFLQSFAIPDKSVPLQLERNVANDLHVNIASSHHGNVIFRVLTLMLSLKPHTTATQHTTPQQHHNTYNDRQRQRDRDRERQDNATQDKRRLQTVGNLKRVMVTNHTCLFEILTTLTFRALHRKSHWVNTISHHQRKIPQKPQNIVTHMPTHTLTFHDTDYPSHRCFSLFCAFRVNPWTIQ